MGIVLWVTLIGTQASPGVLDNFGSVKGWDFPQFYVDGWIVAHGLAGRLHESAFVHAVAAEQVSPQVDYTYGVYGPQIGLVFSPLARLPYPWALRSWQIVSAVLYAVAWWSLLARPPADTEVRRSYVLVAFALPALVLDLAYGQLAVVLLAAVTLGFSALRRGCPIRAGLLLGALFVKPQLLIPFCAVLVVGRAWRVLAGIALGCAGQVLVTAWVLGSSVWVRYAAMVYTFGDIAPALQSKPHLQQSLAVMWRTWFVTSPVALLTWALACVGIIVVAGVAWARTSNVDLRGTAALCAMTLSAAHFYVYDLLALAPVLLWLPRATWHGSAGRRALVGSACTLLALCPLVDPAVALATGMHVTPVALLGALAAASVGAAEGARLEA